MARQNFGGFGGGNMQQLMRQAQKMQQQMLEAQEKLDASEYEGSAAGGNVTVKMNGKHELLSITIRPECVDPDDVEMLKDMIVAAVNDTVKKIDDTKEAAMGAMAPGMKGMGGLF